MVQEHRAEYSSLWASIESIAPKIGGVPQTLNDWVRRAEIDAVARQGVTAEKRERVKALEHAPGPLDRVNRQFNAERPNQLWVSDFTYVSKWQGWQYVVFAIDVYARQIVGWHQSSSMRTDFVLDALEQA
jgi:transposase InsO family protein